MRVLRFLLSVSFVLTAVATARADNPSAARRIVYGTPPATCSAATGDVYVDTSVTPPEPKYCGAANTWVRFGGGKVNAQSGTSYTFVTGDQGKLVTFSNASAVAATLPQANSTTFLAGWHAHVFNRGAGAVTITPAVSTINGAASLQLALNDGAVIFSDGSNYSALVTRAGVTSIAGTANQVTASASAGAVTLTLPQNVHTGATPQFARLGLGAAADSTAALYTNGGHANVSSSSTLAWGGSYVAAQVGGNNGVMGVAARGAAGSTNFYQNAYHDGAGWKYISTDEASLLNMANGEITFYVAASGAAGGAVALVEGLKVNVSGITNFRKGADVASASTITPTGNAFTITGTTTVTTISAAGLTAGTVLYMVTAGAVTFDETGNIDVTGATTLTTAAGDLRIALWDGTKWRLR